MRKYEKFKKTAKKLLHFYFIYGRIPVCILLAVARINMKGSEKMILEYVLLVLLLVSAAFIVVAVILQQSNEDGLSSTISGGSETFYGKDKSSNTDRALYRWTLIASIIFCVAVLVVYVIQPDYAASYDLDAWKSLLSDYSHVFGE